MSKSRPSLSPKQQHWAARAILLASVVAVAFGLPRLQRLADRRAAQLVASADALQASDPAQAESLYRQAAVLKPRDHSINSRIADMYVRLDQPDRAVKLLQESGGVDDQLAAARIIFNTGRLDEAAKTVDESLQRQTSTSALVLSSQIKLEQGRGEEATQAARQALDYDLRDEAAQLQLGLCYAVATKTAELQQYISGLGASKAAQELRAASGQPVALARLLYAQRLLRSAETVITRQPGIESEGYVLLGQIKLSAAKPSPTDLAGAKAYLTDGLKRDPGNLDLHLLLLKTYRLQNDPAAARELDLVQRLRSGRI